MLQGMIVPWAGSSNAGAGYCAHPREAKRTHGGIAESRVPFILNYPLNEAYAQRAARGGLRNFHIFDFAINGVQL